MLAKIMECKISEWITFSIPRHPFTFAWNCFFCLFFFLKIILSYISTPLFCYQSCFVSTIVQATAYPLKMWVLMIKGEKFQVQRIIYSAKVAPWVFIFADSCLLNTHTGSVFQAISGPMVSSQKVRMSNFRKNCSCCMRWYLQIPSINVILLINTFL